MDTETIIEKLNRISAAWKAQWEPPFNENWGDEYFQVKPNLPLKWHADGGLLFLDAVWIAPTQYLKLEELDEAVAWVNPVVIQIPLYGGHLDIAITKDIGETQYAISNIERIVVRDERGVK